MSFTYLYTDNEYHQFRKDSDGITIGISVEDYPTHILAVEEVQRQLIG